MQTIHHTNYIYNGIGVFSKNLINWWNWNLDLIMVLNKKHYYNEPDTKPYFMVMQPSGNHQITQPETALIHMRSTLLPFISPVVPPHLCYLHISSHRTRQQCADSYAAVSEARLWGLVQNWTIRVRQWYTYTEQHPSIYLCVWVLWYALW